MQSFIFLDIVLIILWTLLFSFSRQSLRRKMIFSSLLLTPTGLLDYFFNPEYWNPSVIFSWHKLNFESLLFAFAVGGIVAVSYDLLFRKSIRKEKERSKAIWLLIGVAMITVLLASNTFLDLNFMYDIYLAMITGAILLLFLRWDLKEEMLTSGAIFAILYLLIFEVAIKIYPDFVNQWTLANLSGYFLFGTPSEEIIWAFLLGVVWAPVFEEIVGYRMISLPDIKTKDEVK